LINRYFYINIDINLTPTIDELTQCIDMVNGERNNKKKVDNPINIIFTHYDKDTIYSLGTDKEELKPINQYLKYFPTELTPIIISKHDIPQEDEIKIYYGMVARDESNINPELDDFDEEKHKTHLILFHQFELLFHAESPEESHFFLIGLLKNYLSLNFDRVVKEDDITIKQSDEKTNIFPYVDCNYEIYYKGIEVGSGGYIKNKGFYGYAFGIERLLMAKHELDDIKRVNEIDSSWIDRIRRAYLGLYSK
jgi:hypothetical protein